MIAIPVVESCPHTVTGQGLIHITQSIISSLAGAVKDKHEWMVLLHGTRSADGTTIRVNRVSVPEHTRSSTNCELKNPEVLAKDVVGVLHSHHSMGAFFSHTDKSQLNPRFPSSIVIADTRSSSRASEQLFGFDYQAEGQVRLPCGSIGTLPFMVLPDPLPKEWPVSAEAGFKRDLTVQKLGLCTRYTSEQSGITQKVTTECGLSMMEASPTIFGGDGVALLAEIEKQATLQSWGTGYNNWKEQDNWHNREGLAINDHRPHRPPGMSKREWKAFKKGDSVPDFDSKVVLEECTECNQKKTVWAFFMHYGDGRGVCTLCKPGYTARLMQELGSHREVGP